jgi:hypothetical protein
MIVEVGTRDAPNTSQFSYGEGIGLAMDALAGFESTLAAAIILVLIFVRLSSPSS